MSVPDLNHGPCEFGPNHDWRGDGLCDSCGAKWNESPDANVESVRIRLLNRSFVGIKKYGTTTMRDDLTPLQWLRHLQEELMDATVYIEAMASKLERMCEAPTEPFTYLTDNEEESK